jgi:hypothetical protein
VNVPPHNTMKYQSVDSKTMLTTTALAASDNLNVVQ